MIKIRMIRLSGFQYMNYYVVNCVALRLIPDRSIDMVFSIGTFLHMPWKVADEHFREVFRVLREGGLFRFTVTQVLLPIRIFTTVRRLGHGNASLALRSHVEGDLSEGRYYAHASLTRELMPPLAQF